MNNRNLPSYFGVHYNWKELPEVLIICWVPKYRSALLWYSHQFESKKETHTCLSVSIKKHKRKDLSIQLKKLGEKQIKLWRLFDIKGTWGN